MNVENPLFTDSLAATSVDNATVSGLFPTDEESRAPWETGSPSKLPMVRLTGYLSPDEKVLRLHEVTRPETGHMRLRRWQLWFVRRDGHLAMAVVDLGPAERFRGIADFVIYSGWEDTAAQVQDEANEQRQEGVLRLRKFLLEKAAESTLIARGQAHIHELNKQMNNQSVIGPGFRRQRNLFAKRR